MKPENILLISGSHRCKKTTSNSILDYVEKKLLDFNLTVIREQLFANVSDKNLVSRLSDHLKKCDTVVLCFPLYFDTLPYPLVLLFEELAAQSRNDCGINIFTVVHCGLPESNHCKNSLQICRQFYQHMGFCLRGEVVIPDTGAVDGAGIARIKRIKTVLDNLVDVIMYGETGDSIARIIAKPSFHPYVFRILGNVIMKHFAKKNKADIFQKIY